MSLLTVPPKARRRSKPGSLGDLEFTSVMSRRWAHELKIPRKRKIADTAQPVARAGWWVEEKAESEKRNLETPSASLRLGGKIGCDRRGAESAEDF